MPDSQGSGDLKSKHWKGVLSIHYRENIGAAPPEIQSLGQNCTEDDYETDGEVPEPGGAGGARPAARTAGRREAGEEGEPA